MCAIFGRTLLRWFMGDADRRHVAAVNLSVAAGSLLLAFGDGKVTLVAGCVLFGWALAIPDVVAALIVQREFRSPTSEPWSRW